MSEKASLKRWLDKLSKRLAALGEIDQRVLLFSRSVSKIEPSAAASTLDRIFVNGFFLRDLPSRLILEAAVLALAKRVWPEDHRAQMLQFAVRRRKRIARIFAKNLGASLDLEEKRAFPVPNYSSDRPLTLGERRSLASQPDRKLIEMALRDPHPMVVAKLLDNPKMTENDAVFIAARRPAPPAALIELAMHPRFRISKRTARALINNPALPANVALSLVPFMDLPYMAKIASGPGFGPLVQQAALEILRLKKSLKQPAAPDR
jgi:hypothetical protein